jgi:ABC-type phosphate transport system permease subunit
MIYILAEATVAAPFTWWQIVTGVLAIPTAIVGIILAIAQIRRTRAETAKLLRELSEQTQLQKSEPKKIPVETSPQRILSADEERIRRQVFQHAHTLYVTFLSYVVYTALLLVFYVVGAIKGSSQEGATNSPDTGGIMFFIAILTVIGFINLRVFAHENRRLRKALFQEP